MLEVKAWRNFRSRVASQTFPVPVPRPFGVDVPKLFSLRVAEGIGRPGQHVVSSVNITRPHLLPCPDCQHGHTWSDILRPPWIARHVDGQRAILVMWIEISSSWHFTGLRLTFLLSVQAISCYETPFLTCLIYLWVREEIWLNLVQRCYSLIISRFYFTLWIIAVIITGLLSTLCSKWRAPFREGTTFFKLCLKLISHDPYAPYICEGLELRLVERFKGETRRADCGPRTRFAWFHLSERLAWPGEERAGCWRPGVVKQQWWMGQSASYSCQPGK